MARRPVAGASMVPMLFPGTWDTLPNGAAPPILMVAIAKNCGGACLTHGCRP